MHHFALIFAIFGVSLFATKIIFDWLDARKRKKTLIHQSQ